MQKQRTSRLLVLLAGVILLSGCDFLGLPNDPGLPAGESSEVSQDITSDTTFSSGGSYSITEDVSVTDGATLTIEAGATLVFSSGASLSVGDDSSAIEANGTASNPVTMRGEQQQAGFWQGVGIYSTNARNVLDYVEVSDAGGEDWSITGPDQSAAIMVEADKRLTLSNSTVSDSAAVGIYGNGGVDLSGFSTNTFTDNADAPIEVSATAAGYVDGASSFSGNDAAYVAVYERTIEDDMTISALDGDFPFLFSGDTEVSGSATLTIEDGVEMEFASAAGLSVSADDAALVAEGSSTDGIVMRGAQVQAGFWQGVGIYSTNARNVLDYVEVSDAGGEDWSITGPDQSAAIMVEAGKRVTVSNSTVENSGSVGLYGNGGVDLSGFVSNAFTNNGDAPIELSASSAGYVDGATTFSGNGGSYVAVYARAIDDDMTLSALDGDLPYRFDGDTDVSGTATLTIEDGVEIEFTADAGLTVTSSDAALVADGTSADGILFTGSENQQGWWRSILFKSDNAANLLDHVVVESAGSTTSSVAGVDPTGAVVLDDDSALELTNSTIRDSGGYGLWQNSSNVTVTASGNSYSNNSSGNVYP